MKLPVAIYGIFGEGEQRNWGRSLIKNINRQDAEIKREKGKSK